MTIRNKHISFSLFSFVLLVFLLAGCKKKSQDLIPDTVDVPTAYNLYDICFTKADTGFIVGGDNFTDGMMLKTFDGGLTWTMKDSINPWVLNSIVTKSAHQFSFVDLTGKIFTGSHQADTFSIFQTAEWQQLNAITFYNDTLGLAVGGYGYGQGIIQRTVPRYNGFWVAQKFNHLLQDVQMTDGNTGYACGFGAIYKTTDGAATWQITSAQGDFFRAEYFVNNDLGYVVGYAGTILKTTDGGKTWNRLRNGNSLFNKDWNFNDVLFTDANTGYVVGNSGVFLKTVDGGLHWQQSAYFNSNNIRKLYLSPKNELWLVGDAGGVYKLSLN